MEQPSRIYELRLLYLKLLEALYMYNAAGGVLQPLIEDGKYEDHNIVHYKNLLRINEYKDPLWIIQLQYSILGVVSIHSDRSSERSFIINGND